LPAALSSIYRRRVARAFAGGVGVLGSLVVVGGYQAGEDPRVALMGAWAAALIAHAVSSWHPRFCVQRGIARAVRPRGDLDWDRREGCSARDLARGLVGRWKIASVALPGAGISCLLLFTLTDLARRFQPYPVFAFFFSLFVSS